MSRALGRLRLRSPPWKLRQLRKLPSSEARRIAARHNPVGSREVPRESMPIADSRSAIRKYLSAGAHFLTSRSYMLLKDTSIFIRGNQMTNALWSKKPRSDLITAPRRSFSPPAIGSRGDNQLGTDVLRTLRTPSVSQSRSFRLNFFSEPTSKSMRRDMTAREFVACTKV
jgi:hypothetical protein